MKKRYIAGLAAMLLAAALTGCGSGARDNGSSDIGKDEAQRIAMEDAGVNESEVTRLKVAQDRDDGQKVYDIQFTQDSVDYEYEVLASNGDILSADREQNVQQAQTDANTQQQTDAKTSSEAQPQSETQASSKVQPQSEVQASSETQPQSETQVQPSAQSQNSGAGSQSGQQVALSQEEAIAMALERVPGASEQDIRIELDYDDGQYKYEGDIIYDQKEYEFEIDANSGTFLEWSEERH